MDPIKLNLKQFRDKVYACWIGKNIGGTMGGPYEGKREMLDIHGFVTKASKPLPNDDLDLQLVWLHAVETAGPYNLTAEKLAEYWLSFIPPYWNEYGIGKNNLMRGLLPPLSGDYQNPWCHSNGAWIRTEVWASLAPAAPDVAAKYAIEDAMVDHGVGEGTYAAAFVAAMQSAAFVLNDIPAIIEAGLSHIPETSRVATSIRLLQKCYADGLSPVEAREKIRLANEDIGDGWFEAPSNVAYTVLGLLYGNKDFKKSMILAINCGDDTDCTGATVGATLGILGGTAIIPDDWRAYIGDDIITVAVATGLLRGIPATCTELTDRVIAKTPVMLIANKANVVLTEGETEIPADVNERFLSETATQKRLNGLKPYTVETDYLFGKVLVTYSQAPDIAPFGEIGVHVCFENDSRLGNIGQNLTLRWLLPEGFTVEGGRSALRLEKKNAHEFGHSDVDFVIHAGERVEPVNRAVLEVTAVGRMSASYIPVVLLG